MTFFLFRNWSLEISSFLSHYKDNHPDVHIKILFPTASKDKDKIMNYNVSIVDIADDLMMRKVVQDDIHTCIPYLTYLNKRPLGLTAPLSNNTLSMIHSLINTQ